MGELKTNAKCKSASIEAVITRADGTVEKLGVISYYHSNPLMVLLWKVKRWLTSLRRPAPEPLTECLNTGMALPG